MRTRNGRKRAGGESLVMVMSLLLAGTACTDSPRRSAAPSPPPTVAGFCTEPAVTTPDLRSHRPRPPATFTTDGSELFVLLSGFEHGLPFDRKVGSSAVYFGVISQLPTWDPQRDVVTGVLREVTAREDVPLGVVLPAGRYWIWVTNGPQVRLVACKPGALSDVVVADGVSENAR